MQHDGGRDLIMHELPREISPSSEIDIRSYGESVMSMPVREQQAHVIAHVVSSALELVMLDERTTVCTGEPRDTGSPAIRWFRDQDHDGTPTLIGHALGERSARSRHINVLRCCRNVGDTMAGHNLIDELMIGTEMVGYAS